jgi:hypothetical protein
MVPWDYASPLTPPATAAAVPSLPPPRLASGTHRGLRKLVALKDSKTGKTLVDFLKAEAS